MIKQLPLPILMLFIFSFNLVQGQDVHFSQFALTPTLLNPALAGSEKQSQAIINYRNQWKSLGNPYTSFHASLDYALTKINNSNGYLAAGIDITSDKAGASELKQLQSVLSLAYHARIGENSQLGVGLSGGFGQRSVNYSNLQWGSQFDGNAYNGSLAGGEAGGANSISFADIGAGIQWSYSKGERYMSGNDQRKATLGISLLHINQPACSFYSTNEKLNRKFVASGQFLLGIPNSALSILPGFLYSQQGSLTEVLVGTRIRYLLEQESNYTGFEKGKAISLGTFYRAGDAFITSLHLEMGKLEFCVSYDFTLSSLEQANNGRGGMELALKYSFVTANQKGSSKRY
ncbi:MAG: PorP/SprF family type IX secretion system membrane protein [Bacteroidota bacterium]|jgi:type IX secretion system PorP/SprF family membrane protein